MTRLHHARAARSGSFSARAIRAAAAIAMIAMATVGIAPGASGSHAVSVSFEAGAPGNGATLVGSVSIPSSAAIDIEDRLTHVLRSFRLTAQKEDDASLTVVIHERAWEVNDQVQEYTPSPTPSWSTYISGGRYLPNGKYGITLRATASSLLSEDSAEARRTGLLVNNPPVAPAGVQASLADGLPAVSWAANREPDLVEYRVFRSTDGKTFAQAAVTKATSFAESSADPGASYSYRVLAVRTSPVEQNQAGCGRFLTCSGQSQASNTVTVPLPPAPSPSPGSTTPPTGGTEVSPGSEGSPGGNPVRLPAPAPSPVAPVVAPTIVTQAPRRDTKFAPLLPYSQPIPRQEVAEEEPQAADEEPGEPPIVLSANAERGSEAVDKTPFMAAALLLVVASLHVGRAARRLVFGGPQEVET